MALMTIKDHWVFLEEIEAPMWVDLNLEAKSCYRDTDDAWFRTSHMFHQCSSRLLKDAFLNSGESSMSSDFESNGSSSPKLSSSVSRSRGKEYTSKKWKGQDDDFSPKKEHQVMGLNEAPSSLNAGSSGELKSKLSFVNSKRTSRLKTNAASETVSDGNTRGKGSKAIPGQRNLDVNGNSLVDKGTENITSTITFESNQQPDQTNPEITSKAFGRSSGLLSALKVGLRKSCATRQASRVEIGFNERESRDRKSSSGKSSVGSSSNTGYDVKKSARALILSKETTPYSRNVSRMTEAAVNKIKESNLPKASHVLVENNIGKGSRVVIGNLPKSACQDAVKSKVQPRAKALNSQRVNERASVGVATIKEKVKVGGPSKLVIAGIENKAGPTTVNQKCRSGNISTKAVSRSQRGAKINLSQKGDSTRMVITKGRVSSPSSGKHLRNVTQRIHLR